MSYYEKPDLDELIYDTFSDEDLMHYGMPRRSGRYPWGSGEEPYQHSGDFLSAVNKLKEEGLSEKEIAEYYKMSTTDFRNEYKVAKNDRRYLEVEQAKGLLDKGYNTYKIAEIMDKPESTIRSLLDPNKEARMNEARSTYNFIKDQFKEKQFIDIGEGVERDLNISRGKLDEAIYMLKMEGYETYERYIDNVTNPGKKITVKVLCPPDTTYQDFINTDQSQIGSMTDFTSTDGGENFHKRFVYPKSMDSSRLQIRYKEDGGIDKDGIIELRRGVDDLSLGKDKYAQVRILVDNDRYLKGMAVYSDNMPDGVDVIFNTNKSKDIPMRDVLKKVGDDPNNPFGSTIKTQQYYKDENGVEQLGLINKRAESGDWKDWSNNLPSQFLSKQNLSLIKRQLNEAYDIRKQEYDNICNLTNPTVKKALLQDFADGCDSAAVHLKAAALPRQQYHVIIPINSLKDNEIYAPNYNDGEELALVRYPHGGLFEIPKLIVNNKNATAKQVLGSDVVDAVGINSKVAERLSGADFDGDTVMVIPTNNKVKISNKPPLDELVGFDPKVAYATNKKTTVVNGKEVTKYYDDNGNEVKIMSEKAKQIQMGVVSNLITDMTLMGATNSELARAVKHSMVVIDAEKHKLDYKRSESENDIKSLKNKYQRVYNEELGEWVPGGGSSTIISRASGPTHITKRQGTPKINKKGESWYDPSKPEGAYLYKESEDAHYAERIKDENNPDMIGYKLHKGGQTPYFDRKDKEKYDYYKPVKKVDEKTGEVYFTNKTGELRYNVKTRTQSSTRMADTDDAYSLVSHMRTDKELAYAEYANKLKALGNQARKEKIYTEDIAYSPSANQTYRHEVNSLLARLNEAAKNQTRERKAQLLAGAEVEAAIQDNPNMSKSDIKKRKDQALQRARYLVGAKRNLIEVSDKEWEAIQAGAISKTKLAELLKYTNMDTIRQKAMPRSKTTLTNSQLNRVKSMIKSGRYTNKQIADALGVSVSTIYEYTKGEEQ